MNLYLDAIMTRLLTLLTAALVLNGCAPVEITPQDPSTIGEADRRCFLSQTVVNFRSDNDTTTYVRAGRNGVFELKSGFCRGLSSASSLAFSGGQICTGETVDMNVSGRSLTNENNNVCRAKLTRHLAPDEVAALPPRLRP